MQKISLLHFDYRAGRLQTKPTYAFFYCGISVCLQAKLSARCTGPCDSLFNLINLYPHSTSYCRYCFCAVVFSTGESGFSAVATFVWTERCAEVFGNFPYVTVDVWIFFLHVYWRICVSPASCKCLHAAVCMCTGLLNMRGCTCKCICTHHWMQVWMHALKNENPSKLDIGWLVVKAQSRWCSEGF